MTDSRSRVLADIAQALANHSEDAGASPVDSPASVDLDSDIAGSEATLRRFADLPISALIRRARFYAPHGATT